MKGYVVNYGPHEVLCREGDPSSDLYYLQSGKLLICTIQGTQVKAIDRIGPGEFIGELSFFDGKPRASNVVTLEACQVVQFSKKDLTNLLPVWYQELHKSITKKIRMLDAVIHSSSIKKITSDEQKTLSIDDQRKLYSLLAK